MTAKASLKGGDSVLELMKKSKRDQIKLLIVRVPTSQLDITTQLEAEGAFIVDTLVYYAKSKADWYSDQLIDGYIVRLAKFEDANRLEDIAYETFKDYKGHYHADDNLKKTDCNQVYSSWAANSCKEQDVADAVLLIEKDDEIAAFATIKVKHKNEIEGVLYGVSPVHRHQGLHLHLMKASQNWAITNGYSRMITSTQITNIAVQKNWIRLGFELESSFYTFHKWFD
ncbi:GNAT family N-acetyltransferase [Methylotenera sp.]|uniref:GNAT family N-acetyltransferase n=1 Tax=Methylotenera sp. TaxID=2051956 RepID=UPI002488CC70|nr:GNAT family N-acetyltransferase [Methylotenera sp.]MDI1299325.1 GNAT family N-acetyltransferase [Methylotenera sp.]